MGEGSNLAQQTLLDARFASDEGVYRLKREVISAKSEFYLKDREHGKASWLDFEGGLTFAKAAEI